MARTTLDLVDPRIAKALSHPMRARILVILNERVASPNEIAEMIDERLPNVSYHVRALQELGCIELVSTAQRRGAIVRPARPAITRNVGLIHREGPISAATRAFLDIATNHQQTTSPS